MKISEMMEHIEHTLCPKDVFSDCPKCREIKSALLKLEEFQQRAEAALIESDENLKVEKAMSLIEDLRDLGEEGKK